MGWEWWFAFAVMGVVSLCLGIVIGVLFATWDSFKLPLPLGVVGVMAQRGSLQSLRNDLREANREVIFRAVAEFNFGDYGLDNVEMAKNEDWHIDLAVKIAYALLPDAP